MNQDEIKKITKRIEYSLGKYQFINDKEDVVQSVLLSFLEKGKGQTVDQAIIDHIRKTYGDSRSRCNSSRKNATLYAKEFQGESVYRDSSTGVLYGHFGNRYQCGINSGDIERFGARVDLNCFLKKISLLDRLLYGLIENYGFSHKEVGDLLLVTESRVCQRYKIIQKRISKVAKKVLEREEQREDQSRQSREVPQAIQKRSELQKESKGSMEDTSGQKGQRLATDALEKISKNIFGTF